MFFEYGQHKSQGLAHNPFKNLIVPRPIGWISTLSSAGLPNLAPYSFFNGVADTPPIVFFAANGRARDLGVKDSQANAEETGEFVVNLATWDLRHQMSASSAPFPPDVDEFSTTGLTATPSRLVKPPRVAESPVNLECRYLRTVELPSDNPANGNFVVFGQVIALHIDDSLVNDQGRVDIRKARPIARLGYMDYAVVDEVFEIIRPTAA